MKFAKRAPAIGGQRRSGSCCRQAVSLLLAIALAMQGLLLLPQGAAGAEPEAMEGHGIEGDPYIVASAEQLDQVRNDLDAWYVLGSDIALTDNWTPIGNYADEYGWWYSDPFTGHFDGAAFSIAGLTINTGGTYQTSAGLFGHVGKSGVVENLTLQSPDVSGIGYSLEGAGALAGQLEGTVRYVYVVGGTIAGDGIADIGGLIGSGMADSLIENSSSSANVGSNYGYYGGLVGELAGGNVTDSYATGSADEPYNTNGGGGLIGSATDAAISGSHASGDVVGAGQNGGLIGNAANTDVSDSYAEGSVTIDFNWEAGGLIGHMSGGSVTDSYASGNIAGAYQIGGLIGNAEDAAISGSHASGRVSGNGTSGGLIGNAVNAAVAFSFAEGQVVADGGMYAGGLIGQMSMGSVTDSYATGDASGSSQIGGLVGSLENDAAIRHSYALGSVSGYYNIGGLVGDALDSSVELSFAEGEVTGGFGPNVGGLIGYMSGSSTADSYAWGSVSGASQFGGLIGFAENGSEISRSYAKGTVTPLSYEEGGGLIGALSEDSSVTDGYYDKVTTGQLDTGRGEPLATIDRGREGSYADWDFSDVWQLDDRIGYPALIAFDKTPPAFKNASVKNEASDRVELVFQEKIAADADVLARFLVEVDGDPVSVDEADGFRIGDETRTLTLVLAEPVRAGQTVTVAYEAGVASPLGDLAGNKMDDDTVAADNLVESKLEIVQLSPADNAENAAAGAALTLVFSDAVTPAAGKRIELRKSVDGRLVESFDVGDENRVTVAGTTVTIIPSAALAPLTGYYATVEAGAFRDAEDRPNMAIAGASRWNFTTVADGEADWVYAGNAGLSDGAAGSPDLFHANDMLYVAYVDRTRGDRITVMQYADAATGWTPVGTAGFTADGARAPSLFVEGDIPYVAYEQRAGGDVQVAVMKFDGSGPSGWTPVGAPLTAGDDSDPSLFVYGGIPHVAYRGAGPDNKAMAARYDDGAGSWAPLGNSGGVSEGDSYTPSLFIDDGTPYMAYQDYVYPGFGATVLKYDALNDAWAMAGPRWFTNDFAFDTSLVIDDGTLYVAYENLAHEAAVMKFDAVSGQWASVGAAGFSADQAYYTSLDVYRGEPYAVYMDVDKHDRATVMKYTGSRWMEVGSRGFSAGMAAEPSIAFMDGIPYVAFEDKGNGRRISVMTYAANDAPTVREVRATGTPEVGLALTGDYAYDDADDDPEGDSKLRWYAADDASGANRTVIAGASGRTLTPGPDQIGKYILFEVTPQARSGKLTGSAVSSAAVGPVTAADSGDDSVEEQYEAEEDQPGDEGFEVIVNGQRNERIAVSRLTQLEGRSAVAVTVDASRLTAQIEDVANPTIVIPVSRQADQIYVELTGEAVAALGRKSGLLELQTPLGTYRIPAAELPVKQLSQLFDGPIDAAQLTYRVNIAQGGADQRTLLEEAARKGDFLVAAPPVDFSVTVSYGGQSLEASRFNAYVEREIPLPAGADPSRITTAVVLESDGSVRHVPTYVSQRDGKYVAVVNSLTNSTYALILHTAAFADMAGHWAEQAVTDMGSRLIVSGVGADSFAPDAPVTRAQFLSIAIRALGLSDRGTSADFRDIADGAWYAGAVAKAAEYGIVRGYEDGTFRPDETITRAEAFVIAASAMKLAGLDTGIGAADQANALSAFSDGERIGAWAAPATAAAVKHGLVRGYQGELHPDASLTRAETAVLLRTLLIRAGLIDGTHT